MIFDNQSVQVDVSGQCIISDDLGNIVLDKKNAVHPMNISRAFARGLSNEPNQFIKRIAFGNGGTFVDIAQNVTYNNVNDGIYPDISGYKSKLYSETYSEIIDDSDTHIGEGANASAKDDPLVKPNDLAGPGVVSVEYQNTTTTLWNSKVVVSCVLNRNEPTSQYISDLNDTDVPIDSAFEFDELALFTGGTETDVPVSGKQTVTFSTPNIYVDTKLDVDTAYTLSIDIDGVNHQYQIYTDQSYAYHTVTNASVDVYTIRFIDLINILNDSIPQLTVSMKTGDSSAGSYFGYMVFSSKTTGPFSSVNIKTEQSNADWLFGNMMLFAGINDSISGASVGVQNNADQPSLESARMLTHLIFDPIRKPMNRTYIIEYILNIVVARTIK
jgi:hypothetical protein